MAKVYFHIDLNAFFANAEILRDPSLKGLPIAVSGTSRRSVVSTASYEARAYGVHSAMPIAEAKQLCKDLVIVDHHFTWYQNLSKQFVEIIEENADEVEQASIDECYADVTETIRKFERPLDLAFKIQREIFTKLGLPCSIGVAPNMFLAKMASDMKKPMGITILRIREVPEKLWPLDIGEMRGVGVKTVPLLKELGINKIGDLANWKDNEKLRPVLGKNTEFMIQRANGYDNRTIVKDWDAKSMGVSETLLDDITDYDEIKALFRTLSRRLSKRMYDEKKAGITVSIRIKYYDFQNADRSAKVNEPMWKSDDLFVQAMSLFDENWNGNPIRLLGLSVTDFADSGFLATQINLFDQSIANREETMSVLKDLNAQLGGNVLKRASQVNHNENQ